MHVTWPYDVSSDRRAPGSDCEVGIPILRCTHDRFRGTFDQRHAARPGRRDGAQAQHAARVPFLDGARLARRDRHDRSRGGRAPGERADSAGVRNRREGFSYTDLQTPMHDVLGHDGTPEAASFAATKRAEIRLYTAAVLRHHARGAAAAGADGAGVSRRGCRRRRRAAHGRLSATGGATPEFRSACTAPAARTRPIYLDADFLIGPEAAHLNISGVSGLATKTSAIEWILSSIFAHFPQQKGSVAAVCFNVKGPDLCFLDQPGEIDAADRALYEKVRRAANAIRER